MIRIESCQKFCFRPIVIKLGIVLLCLSMAILIGILLFIFIERTEPAIVYDNLNTLRLTSILFRHGDRNPTSTYNSDPHKNYDWPGGLGALTNEGKQQLYQLGKTIRQRYNGFLPDDYSEDDIYIKSSSKSRTLMSAYTFLAGLYPPTPNQTWNHEIAWQPIPVHSLPRELDMLLAAKKHCSEYDKHVLNLPNLTEYQNIIANYSFLYETLSNYTNQTINTPRKLEMVYNIWYIQEHYGFELPTWSKHFYPDPLKEVAIFSLASVTFDDFMIRMRAGPLLSEIITNMKMKKNSKLNPNRKMFVYSAHDVTIVSLWRALSFQNNILPDYGAALIFELHNLANTTDLEVKLFYFDDTTVKTPRNLDIPNCKSPCILSYFEEISEKYIPVDWEKECNNV